MHRTPAPYLWLLVCPLGACDLGSEDVSAPLASATYSVVEGELSEGDHAVAFVAIRGESGNVASVCSGTLIDAFATSQNPASAVAAFNAGGVTPPRFVLTARHCIRRSSANADYPAGHVYPPSDVRVSFATRPDMDAAEYRVRSHAFHPNSDIAMLELEQDAPAVPIPLNGQPLEDYVGASIRVAGYGITGTGAGNAGIKRQGTAVILSATTEGVVRDATREALDTNGDVAVLSQGTAGQTICSGDSGGPEFLQIGGIEYVAAVTSFSYGPPRAGANDRIPDCSNPDTVAGVVRVDKNIDFIRTFIQERGAGNFLPEVPNTQGTPGPIVGGCSVPAPHGAFWMVAVALLAVRRRRR